MRTIHRTIPRATHPGLQGPIKSFAVSAPGICFFTKLETSVLSEGGCCLTTLGLLGQ